MMTTKHIRHYIPLLLTLLYGWLPTLLLAQETLTLEETLERAQANNLRIAEQILRLDRAKQLRGTAFDLSKTELSLSQDPTSGGGPDNGFTLSQSFEFPTIYLTKWKKLTAEKDLSESTLRLTRTEVKKEVTGIYYSLQHRQAVQEVLKRQEEVYQSFWDKASAKLKAGEVSRLEQLNAERLLRQHHLTMQANDQEIRALSISLQEWTNSDTPIRCAASTLDPIAAEGLPTQLRYEQTPFALADKQRTEVYRRALQLARQAYLPDLIVGIRRQWILDSYNPYGVERTPYDRGNMMGFEVGVSIPLFFGSTLAKDKAAKRDYEIAQLQAKQQSREMTLRYHTEYQALLRAQKALDYYQNEGSSSALEILRIAKVAYEAGNIGYLEYMQNQEAALELQLAHLNAINEYNQSIINLTYLLGK